MISIAIIHCGYIAALGTQVMSYYYDVLDGFVMALPIRRRHRLDDITTYLCSQC
jgi:hypothetical protein